MRRCWEFAPVRHKGAGFLHDSVWLGYAVRVADLFREQAGGNQASFLGFAVTLRNEIQGHVRVQERTQVWNGLEPGWSRRRVQLSKWAAK